ncbi:MAG: hypothetical protein ACK451_14560, partial [Pseudanabaena sp.]
MIKSNEMLVASTSLSYSGFQISTHSFENKKSVPVRVLSFHFALGKMKTAIGAKYKTLKTEFMEL